MISRLRCLIGHLVIVSFALICHIRHKAAVVICMIGDMLGPAIRQCHRVGALNATCTVGGLPCIKVCPGVVIMYSIFKAVGLRLIGVDRMSRGVIFRCWSVVGRNRSMVYRCRGVVRGIPSLSKDHWQKTSNC